MFLNYTNVIFEAFSSVHLFSISSWKKKFVALKGPNIAHKVTTICFYVDPWKAILGFSCSEHDGRSFYRCLFWNLFFYPLFVTCYILTEKKPNLLTSTCDASRMSSHVTWCVSPHLLGVYVCLYPSQKNQVFNILKYSPGKE